MTTPLKTRRPAFLLLVLATCANPAEVVPPPPATSPADRVPEWGGTLLLATCDERDAQDFSCTAGGFTLLRPGMAGEVILKAPYVVADPAWSPDGNWIAFTADVGCVPFTLVHCRPEVYRLDRRGASLKRLGPAGKISLTPAWSPDGMSIAFSVLDSPGGAYQLMIMRADGSELQSLGGLSGLFPAWSPDGSRIAYAAIDQDGQSAIFDVNRDGSAPVQVSHPSRDQTGTAWDSSPAWSPDGGTIAFTHGVVHTDGHSSCQVHAMKPDGSGVTVLTQDSFCAGKPVWSPGGGSIAYQGRPGQDSHAHGVMLMNSDGTRRFLLRQVGYDFSRVAWTSR